MQNCIPTEVLAHIFLCVCTTDLKSIYSVCSVWRHCCEDYDIIKHRILTKLPHLKSLPRHHFTPQLCEAVFGSYLIVGGEDVLESAKQSLSQKGLLFDKFNTDEFSYNYAMNHNYSRVPDFTLLSKYKAILIFNQFQSFQNRTIDMGNELIKYIENGGGVVQCLHTFNDDEEYGGPCGAYERYCPFKYGDDRATFEMSSGAKYISLVKEIPDHFLLAGVDSFRQSVAALCCNTERKGESEIVARFDDTKGTTAVAFIEIPGKNKGRVCALNIFPNSNEWNDSLLSGSESWDTRTNGIELIVNALLFSGLVTNKTS